MLTLTWTDVDITNMPSWIVLAEATADCDLSLVNDECDVTLVNDDWSPIAAVRRRPTGIGIVSRHRGITGT